MQQMFTDVIFYKHEDTQQQYCDWLELGGTHSG